MQLFVIVNTRVEYYSNFYNKNRTLFYLFEILRCMSINKRTKTFVKSQKITMKAFERSINASNGYINNITRSIGLEKIDLIVEKYPLLNIEWLLTGKGDMLKPLSAINEPADQYIIENETTRASITAKALLKIDASVTQLLQEVSDIKEQLTKKGK